MNTWDGISDYAQLALEDKYASIACSEEGGVCVWQGATGKSVVFIYNNGGTAIIATPFSLLEFAGIASFRSTALILALQAGLATQSLPFHTVLKEDWVEERLGFPPSIIRIGLEGSNHGIGDYGV